MVSMERAIAIYSKCVNSPGTTNLVIEIALGITEAIEEERKRCMHIVFDYERRPFTTENYNRLIADMRGEMED